MESMKVKGVNMMVVTRKIICKYLLATLFLLMVGMGYCLSARAMQQQSRPALFTQNIEKNEYHASVLKKVISVDLNNAPFEKGLRIIAKKAGLKLVFSEDIIPVTKRVSLYKKNIKLEDVLWALLAGTDLRFGISSHDHLVIIKSSEEYEKAEKQTQQLEAVSGMVTDATSGKALPSVNIKVKGTTTGTFTDDEGQYELSVPSLQDTLVFSFVGYQQEEVPINGRTTVDVALKAQALTGEELVVVGYGTQRESDVTGSIARMSTQKIKELQNQPVSNFMGGLSGQIAGVQVQETSHAPGAAGLAIRVRGSGSISAGNSPLYVVDGFPMDDEEDVNMINSNNIKSVEVLKDASSTAIYGSRGSNGVVLITTKKGQSGEARISLNIQDGIQQVANKPKMMNTTEYIQWFKDAHNNAWVQAGGNADDPNSVRTGRDYTIPAEFNDPSSLPNTNWEDEIFRAVPIQKYNATVSGGSKTSKYFISGGYTNQQGVVINTDYEKMDINANVSGTTFGDRLEVGLNILASYSKNNQVENGKYGPVELSLVVPPIYPAFDKKNNYYGSPLNSNVLNGDDPSPIETAKEIDNQNKNYRTLWKGFADLQLIQGLNFKTSISGLFRHNVYSYFRPSYVNIDSNPAPNSVSAESSTLDYTNWLWNNTLTFNRDFNKNSINAVAGFTYQSQNVGNNDINATNFPTDNIHTLSAGQVTGGGSSISEYTLLSYLARINYTFNNRYLLTTTGRIDGSSRFGANNKWGFFPSLALGWRISEEEFMQNVKFINNLKLRVSYGLTGNNSIPDYGSVGTLSSVNYVGGAGSGSVITGVTPNNISNPDLSWEKSRQLDIGLNTSLFEDRLSVDIDYYHNNTTDLLLNVPIPTTTGFSTQLQNIGEVKNQGWDIAVESINIQGEFNWQTNFNISFNHSKVLATGPENQAIFASAPNVPDGFITEVGKPIANFYGYDFIGVFQTSQELDNYPHPSQFTLGDPIIRDVNGDGKIDSNDRAIIGNNQPDFTFGLNNNIGYQNFDLGVKITGSYGGEVFSTSSRFTKWYHGNRNAREAAKNRYRSPEQPGDGEYFIARSVWEGGEQKQPSSYWVQDGSYLRIRDVTLGYNFPKIANMPFQSCRLYFSVHNAYTFTNYFGFDPESSTGSGLTRGGDYTSYPSARIFTLGLNISI